MDHRSIDRLQPPTRFPAALPALALIGLLVAGCEDPADPDQSRFPFMAITAGSEHTCAYTDINDAFCWGRGVTGALGNGGSVAASTPQLVEGGHKFDVLSGGGAHTCGSKENGEALCWGSDSEAQLGAERRGDSSTPLLVQGQLAMVGVSAGGQHSCGRTTGAEVRCWGWNFFGQLGNGDRIDLGSPSDPVTLGEPFIEVDSGEDFSCGVTDAGAVYCWGRNDLNQLGSTAAAVLCENEFVSAPCNPVPVRVPAEVTFSTVSAGEAHACALTADGAAYCWGDGTLGQLGDGAMAVSTGPVPVAGSHSFTSISAGSDHTCAVDRGGTVFCWGSNAEGRLGTGDAGTVVRTAPAPIASELQFADVAAGKLHSCAIVETSGEAYCWGFGGFGQLGTGSTGSSSVPARVFNSGGG